MMKAAAYDIHRDSTVDIYVDDSPDRKYGPIKPWFLFPKISCRDRKWSRYDGQWHLRAESADESWEASSEVNKHLAKLASVLGKVEKGRNDQTKYSLPVSILSPVYVQGDLVMCRIAWANAEGAGPGQYVIHWELSIFSKWPSHYIGNGIVAVISRDPFIAFDYLQEQIRKSGSNTKAAFRLMILKKMNPAENWNETLKYLDYESVEVLDSIRRYNSDYL